MVTVPWFGLTKQSMKVTGHITVHKDMESSTTQMGMCTMVSGMIIELRVTVSTLQSRGQDTRVPGTTTNNMATERKHG